MKVFIPISSLTVLAALLSPAAVAKKEPHRIFRATRSKAAKAEATLMDTSSPPHDEHDEPHLDLGPPIESKAGKAVVGNAKTLKEYLHKAGKEAKSKASKSKCHKEDADLDLTDFDLMLDFSSLSMSISMSYRPAPKSAKSTKGSKCTNYKGNAPDTTEADHNDWFMFDDDWWHLEDDWFRFDDDWWYHGDDWFNDDYWWYYGDDANNADDYHVDDFFYDANATEIIRWFLQMQSECAGIPLDDGSCLVQNVIEVLASESGPPNDLSVRKLRGIDARKMQNAYSNYPYDDVIQPDCELPAEDEIAWVVNQALSLCQDSQIDVTEEDWLDTIDRFTRIFTNVTCVCGMY
jgi:hypothetical protein